MPSVDTYIAWLADLDNQKDTRRLTPTRRNATIAELFHQKDETIKEVITQSYKDTVTGLLNRRAFDALYTQLTETKRPFGLFFVDIDGFKKINDTYGHPVGDTILQQVGSFLPISIRQDKERQPDIVARVAGDEFGILLPDITSEEHMQYIGNRINQTIEQQFAPLFPRATISIGGGVYRGDGSSHFLKRVDEALYTAKREGKNRTIISHWQNAPTFVH